MPIEKLSPALDAIIDTDAPIAEHGSGYGGSEGPAEGPLWWSDGGYLLFSDIHNNRRMRYTPGSGVTVEAEPVNRHNGLTRDLQGRLLAAEHDGRRISRLEHDGSTTVLANQFQGRQLNRPNDVVVKSDGSIYFTDPWTFRRPREQWEQTISGVYRLSPDLGTLTLLVGDFVVPNGLAFSPDETILYVNDSRKGIIRAFDVQDDGTVSLATQRLFADMRGEREGVPDGMKVDSEGNVYCGGAGGLHIMNPRRRNPGHRGSWAAGYHQPVLRRRRLEDAVLHQPQHAGQRAHQDCGDSGSGEVAGHHYGSDGAGARTQASSEPK